MRDVHRDSIVCLERGTEEVYFVNATRDQAEGCS